MRSVLWRMARVVSRIGMVGALAFGGVAGAQNECSQPPSSIRVNDSYASDPGGSWWLTPNYSDLNANNIADVSDGYNTAGFPLDNPTIMRRAGTQYGSWFYIAGASPNHSFGNIPIYRTQDFRTFYLHMLAFDPSNQGGSGQSQSGNTIFLNGGKRYFNLNSPQLFLDPTQTGSDPVITLNFSAVENTAALNLNPATAANDQYRSCFHVRMRLSQFLSWHTLNPAGNGPRFADARDSLGYQAWFTYRPNNTGSWTYDGGYSQGRNIPISGSLGLLGPSCGQLDYQALGGLTFRCVGPQTWMYRDPFVYFDPTQADSSTWKRMMLFSFLNEPSPLTLQNGIHVAGHPLRPVQFEFDATVNTASYANNYSSFTPPVNGLFNGAVGSNGAQWSGGAAGMSPCAFYANSRHYLLYCRNTPDSPAYQIVYRMSAQNASFTSLQHAGFFSGAGATEYVLLKPTNTTTVGGTNFGDPEVFNINEVLVGPVIPKYYLLFRVRPANSSVSVVFFKELTFDPATGQILQLSDLANEPDPRRNISYFRLPLCRF